MAVINCLESDLSPEKLTCDCKLSDAEVKIKAKYLNDALAEAMGVTS